MMIGIGTPISQRSIPFPIEQLLLAIAHCTLLIASELYAGLTPPITAA